jgi:hypothetical protein
MSDETDIDTTAKAAVIVHWPTGPVHCCIEHSQALLGIAWHLGTHVHAEPYFGDEPCANCKKKKERA